MFRNKLYTHILLLACMASLLSCSSTEEPSQPQATETITLIIAVPQADTTRVGDPGYGHQEGEDWDKLSVIITYTELADGSTGSPVVRKTLTRQEFENLPVYVGTTYRQLKLNVWKGTIRIYGVAFSDGVAGNPEADIIKCSSDGEVQALTISNDYASGNVGKFLSVATGYYCNDNGEIADYDMGMDADYGEIKPVPSIKLTRLATKIDIQWDAQDAYTQGYTDVKVEGFTFYNTPEEPGTEAGKGKGCLFPELYNGTETFAGQSEFLNTSAVSKRNGRVYHYVFPSSMSPHVKFKLSAIKDDNTQENDYTFQFGKPIQKAAWYKVNTTIRGVTGNTTITLDTN